MQLTAIEKRMLFGLGIIVAVMLTWNIATAMFGSERFRRFILVG